MLLGPTAFKLTLMEKGGGVVGVVGNLGDDGAAMWELRMGEEGRSSLLRFYDKGIGLRDGTVGANEAADTAGLILAAECTQLASQLSLSFPFLPSNLSLFLSSAFYVRQIKFLTVYHKSCKLFFSTFV